MSDELRNLSKEIWGKEMEKYVLNTDAMLYIKNLKHENEQLQERIDKVIEYVKKELSYTPSSTRKEVGLILIDYKKLLNILKGE